MDSGLHVVDFGFLVSGTWIPDCNSWRDSGLLKLNNGFQSPGFWVPQAKHFLSIKGHAIFFLPALLNLNFKQTHSLKALIDLHWYNLYKLRKHNRKLRF